MGGGGGQPKANQGETVPSLSLLFLIIWNLKNTEVKFTPHVLKYA